MSTYFEESYKKLADKGIALSKKLFEEGKIKDDLLLAQKELIEKQEQLIAELRTGK